MAKITSNTLCYGDNLDILRGHVDDDSVDLIYLDPPFQSGQNYNVLFQEKNGTASKAQIQAFEDTWHWDLSTQEALAEIIDKCPQKVVKTITGLHSILGNNDMMAYLVMMAIRLMELHRVLKDTGTIYLHCDPTASHYLKIIMDSVFGSKNFLNEIVWCYRGAGYPKKDFGKRHDIILRYSETNNYIFNLDDVREEYAEATKERFKHHIGNIRDGKDFGVQALHPKGKQPDDWWQIQPIAPSAKERLGYPTQKPRELLEKIVKASSNKGDIVLDPFCGCGTAVVVAQELGRKWIGIDITHLSFGLIKHRLRHTFGDRIKYKVIGEPQDLSGAKALAEQDRFQFQFWALGLVGARPREMEDKKGADRGIDGYLFFHDLKDLSQVKQIIIQVKSGHVTPSYIRDLKGTVVREKAAIGVFITLEESTREMKKEAASAGFYESPWGKHAKIQILTIKELLGGKEIDSPKGAVDVTLKKAQRVKDSTERQQEIF